MCWSGRQILGAVETIPFETCLQLEAEEHRAAVPSWAKTVRLPTDRMLTDALRESPQQTTWLACTSATFEVYEGLSGLTASEWHEHLRSWDECASTLLACSVTYCH